MLAFEAMPASPGVTFTMMNIDLPDFGMPPALADWLRAGEWRWRRHS